MNVAYFSPMPPERSGVADYSALLLPALRERIDVRLARPRNRPRADVALYQIGNSAAAHGWVLAELRRRPGLVVLHEFVLQHLIAGTTLAHGAHSLYLDAMQRDSGLPGRLLAHGVLEKRVPPPWVVTPDLFPLVDEVLDLASGHGIVVHSRHLAERVRATGFTGPIWRIPHPAWPVDDVRPAELDGDPIVGSFGGINPWKRIPELLEAFAALRRTHPRAQLVLGGESSEAIDVEALIARLHLQGSVVLPGHVPESRLWSLLAACDVCVALRSPTMGATSGTAIRALSLGKPLVVTDADAFAELPDDVALKVPIGAGEIVALTAALERLAADRGERERRGAAAQRHAQNEHDLGRVADAYVATIETAAGGPAVRDELLKQVAVLATEVGLDDAPRLGAALREVGIGG